MFGTTAAYLGLVAVRRGGRLGRVADRAAAARWPLAGRAGEIDAVVELITAAAQGEAGALLISGEAGVGKTALVREVVSRFAADAAVLWARCLPLTSMTVPFLPLATALREWTSGQDAPVSVFGGSTAAGLAGFDTWLEALCRKEPVLLVVDDLQWADQSSLDVLMYVLAGLAGRRLAEKVSHCAGGRPMSAGSPAWPR